MSCIACVYVCVYTLNTPAVHRGGICRLIYQRQCPVSTRRLLVQALLCALADSGASPSNIWELHLFGGHSYTPALCIVTLPCRLTCRVLLQMHFSRYVNLLSSQSAGFFKDVVLNRVVMGMNTDAAPHALQSKHSYFCYSTNAQSLMSPS